MHIVERIRRGETPDVALWPAREEQKPIVAIAVPVEVSVPEPAVADDTNRVEPPAGKLKSPVARPEEPTMPPPVDAPQPEDAATAVDEPTVLTLSETAANHRLRLAGQALRRGLDRTQENFELANLGRMQIPVDVSAAEWRQQVTDSLGYLEAAVPELTETLADARHYLQRAVDSLGDEKEESFRERVAGFRDVLSATDSDEPAAITALKLKTRIEETAGHLGAWVTENVLTREGEGINLDEILLQPGYEPRERQKAR